VRWSAVLKDLAKEMFVFLVSVGFAILGAVDGHAFFGAKFEPADGKIYHGAQAEVRPESKQNCDVDWPGIEEYAEACGHHPKLIMHYISFDQTAFGLLRPVIYKISQKGYCYAAQIGLDFYSYGDLPSILNARDITKDISEGKYDEEIKTLAKLFDRMKICVFLRPGYEFGGNGQGRLASKAYWVTAWRRIHDLFKQKGAKNVAFVWNTLDATDYLDYYPGDSYVDWWAVNVFSNQSHLDPFVNTFIQEAGRYRKPVMIAESTPRYVGSIGGHVSWESWYDPYFKLLFQYQHVKAFCYINASWRNYPDPSFAFDCRIQSNSYVSANYKEMLTDPRFIHAKIR
jgi:hypothetical protein